MLFWTIILYLLVLFFCLLFAHLSDKYNNKKLLFFIIIVLSLLGGLRHYSVGVDTYPYMVSIENFFKTGIMSWKYTSFAQGYGVFAVMVYRIYHNYNFLLIIEALIINTLIILRLWDFREKSSFKFMVFVYLLVIYLRTFNINVQYIALSIVFFATRYLDNKKNVKYLLLVALASTIHVSALMGVVYFFVKWFNFKHITYIQFLLKILTIAIGIGISLYAIDSLYLRYSKYLVGRESTIGLMVFAQFTIFIVSCFISNHIKKDKTRGELYNSAKLYYFFGLIASLSSYVINNAGRISYYFMIFEPVFYGIIMKDKKVDRGYKLFIVLWFIMYTIYVLFDTHSSTLYFPYKFFWM